MRTGAQTTARGFEAHSGIDVNTTRKPSAQTFAQSKAEEANPKGDVWWAARAIRTFRSPRAQRGDRRELFDAPVDRFVTEFIGEANLMPATIESVENGAATVAIENYRVPPPRRGLAPGHRPRWRAPLPRGDRRGGRLRRHGRGGDPCGRAHGLHVGGRVRHHVRGGERGQYTPRGSVRRSRSASPRGAVLLPPEWALPRGTRNAHLRPDRLVRIADPALLSLGPDRYGSRVAKPLPLPALRRHAASLLFERGVGLRVPPASVGGLDREHPRSELWAGRAHCRGRGVRVRPRHG